MTTTNNNMLAPVHSLMASMQEQRGVNRASIKQRFFDHMSQLEKHGFPLPSNFQWVREYAQTVGANKMAQKTVKVSVERESLQAVTAFQLVNLKQAALEEQAKGDRVERARLQRLAAISKIMDGLDEYTDGVNAETEALDGELSDKRREEIAAMVKNVAHLALHLAEHVGMVLTIENKAHTPLAMGHYTSVIDLRDSYRTYRAAFAKQEQEKAQQAQTEQLTKVPLEVLNTIASLSERRTPLATGLAKTALERVGRGMSVPLAHFTAVNALEQAAMGEIDRTQAVKVSSKLSLEEEGILDTCTQAAKKNIIKMAMGVDSAVGQDSTTALVPVKMNPDDSIDFHTERLLQEVALFANEPRTHVDKGDPSSPYQQRVMKWVWHAFTPMGMNVFDLIERSLRFYEEATELVQSMGLSEELAEAVRCSVYAKPVGERKQEVGGTMTCLAALCEAAEIDMLEEGERELTRIWGAVEKIRQKNLSKIRSEGTDVHECTRCPWQPVIEGCCGHNQYQNTADARPIVKVDVAPYQHPYLPRSQDAAVYHPV